MQTGSSCVRAAAVRRCARPGVAACAVEALDGCRQFLRTGPLLESSSVQA